MASIQPRRQLVWNVWEEVQTLEKEIKEDMVSTAITSATEKYIRDTKVFPLALVMTVIIIIIIIHFICNALFIQSANILETNYNNTIK